MSSSDVAGNAGSNLWFHPVLLSLMEGRPVQEDLAYQYVQENAATIASQIKTLTENNLDVLAVQIAEWCMKIPALQVDVNVVSNLLFVLNKLGRSEDFHRQCCQLPCCLAKEVMKVMEQSSFQVAVLRIASEIFLLQDLLNPNVSCCTKDLLNFWLSIQKEENLTNELIIENINKMLGIVEEFGTLCTFVEAIFNVFSARFLPLCTDLSLRIFQSQKPLTGSLTYLGTPNCVRLVQTIEIIGKLFRNFTPLYSECLLTSLTLDPSLPRYILTLNFFLGRTSGVPVSACKMLPVDIKVYNSVLQTVGQLRPIQLDRQQSWAHLRQSIIAHLACNGYSLDLSGSAFVRTVNSLSDEAELHRRLMVREEQEANLMPATNLSATNKFGAIQPPKPRSNANKPGSRRQTNINRGLKKLPASTAQQPVITSISTVTTTIAATNNVALANSAPLSYQSYQFQSPESQCVVTILPQVPIISGNSELMPIVVDQDVTNNSEFQNFNQIQVAKSHEMNLSEKCAKASSSGIALENTRELNISLESGSSTSNARIGRGAKMVRAPSRTSPRRLQSNSIDSRSNNRGIKYEDENNIDANPISRRLRTRGSQSESGIIMELSDSKPNNRPDEGKKNSPRRGRPPKISKSNGSSISENASNITPIVNMETSISNGLKSNNIKKLKSFSASKSSFFNIKKYKRHSKQRHLWLKSHKKIVTSALRKVDSGLLNKKRGRPLNSADLPNCFVSLPKLSSSEVIGKRVLKKRKIEDSDIESEAPPKKLMNKKVHEKQMSKQAANITLDPNNKLFSSSESSINPCVCDGCGEVVPDCNWLTAHIVVCPGMTGAGAEEEGEAMMVSSEGTWDQSKLEQQQTSVVQDGEGFIQQASFAEYPVNSADSQAVNENHNFDAFASEGTYVIAPQSPILFGKEIVIDGVTAFEFCIHRCSHCFMVFYTEASLITHLKNSDHFYSSGTKYEVYVCSKCALHFLEKSTLWFHYQYSCGKPMSGAISPTERETYKCWICHKDFLSELFLARHILGKHASDSVAFQCLHQQILQHKKQQAQYQGQFQVAKNSSNFSNLVTADGTAIAVQNVSRVPANQTPQPIVGATGQSQLTTIDTTQISADFYQQATCDLYQSSANLLYSQSDSFPQSGSQRIIAQSNGYFQQPQQQQEFSTVSVLPIAMSESQDVFYGVQSQPAIINSTARVQTQGETYANVSGASENAGVVSISSAPGGGGGSGMRRAAKGIMYKNVYMQCVVNYHCSHCKTDLSTKALKKEHRRSACFDANSNRFSYLRQYSYLCPYCGEKFPSQKVCRQHQLSVCLVLMGVKTDELNFKQHNCPFCNKKYFNVITLKGHLTLAHKDRVDSTDCGAQDADDGGNDDLIGGVGGKYSNLIVNNPLVPIPNLEAGPVFSTLTTSPLKVALQQQQQLQQQPQILPVVENPIVTTEENLCLPAPQVSEPVAVDTSGLTTSGSTVRSVKSKKKSRGKSPVTPQSGSSLASTRSLRNNPRSSRYHYDDDFYSGEDLDVFEPKLSRSISERSDRQTRSSAKVDKEDGKCAKTDYRNGEGSINARPAINEEDADSDATDDLTVDESAVDATINEGHQQSEGSNSVMMQQVGVDGGLTTSLFSDFHPSPGDQVLKEGIDPTAFIEQIPTTNQSQMYAATTYASLQPLESNQITADSQRSTLSHESELEQIEAEHCQGNVMTFNKSSTNKFIIDNLLGYSTPPDSKHNLKKRTQEKECGSDSDCQEDFLITIDSSLDTPADEDDDSKGSSGVCSVKNKPAENPSSISCLPPADHKEKQAKLEKLRAAKQDQPNLFSVTYEKSSRLDRRDDASSLVCRIQSNSSAEHKLDVEDRFSVISSDNIHPRETPEAVDDCQTSGNEAEKEEDSGRVGSGVVMDVKKRTILKKLSNSLNMASKRQPSAVGGIKFFK